jgi:hypothetical protein
LKIHNFIWVAPGSLAELVTPLACVFTQPNPNRGNTFIGSTLFSRQQGYLAADPARNTTCVDLHLGPHLFVERARCRGIPQPCNGTVHYAFDWFFPLGNLVINPLERSFPPNPVITQPAGILILGGAEDIGPDYTSDMAQINDSGDRLIAAMQLARQFPEAVILYTGGKVALSTVDEGVFEVGPDILRQLGLSEDKLIVEGR